MFEHRIRLFKMFGFTVRADPSWFIILFLLIWSLATAYFPAQYPDLRTGTYLLLGVAGAVGLFASIVVHEFCHALVARRYDLPMKGITLWIFGGIAEMERDPDNAKQEFLMAAAGPAASLAIAAAGYAIAAVVPQDVFYVQSVASYLWRINLILAVFNLIPAFPMDGGRMLRSALWKWKGGIRWATRVASNIGAGFGFVLMLLGVLGFISGNFVGGLWYFLIGVFIRWAAKMSYTRLRINESLRGEPIGKFVAEVPAIDARLPVSEAIDQYFYKYGMASYPVVDSDGIFKGIVSAKSIRQIPEPDRNAVEISEAVEPATGQNSIDSETDAAKALSKLSSRQSPNLIVLDGGRPVGSVSLGDLMKKVSLKLAMNGEEDDVSPDLKLSSFS